MTLDQLIDRCRLESQDVRAPYLWDDMEWTAWLNEAETEACIRARLLNDETLTAEVTAGEEYAGLPERAFAVQRVFLGSVRLQLIDRADLDASERERWADETGSPVAAYRVGDKLRIYPIPEADDEARITAFCTPENEMASGADEPEIRSRSHVKLVDWALRCAYLKADPDTQDIQRAERYEARFERSFGPAPDEKALRRMSLKVKRRSAGHYF